MSGHLPSLMVTVVGSDRKQSRVLAQVGEKLRRRGLQACTLKNWRDTVLNDFEILLIGCSEKETESLTRQIEDLWTRKWSNWYKATREKKGVNHVA